MSIISNLLCKYESLEFEAETKNLVPKFSYNYNPYITRVKEAKVQPKTYKELRKLIFNAIEDYGYHCDLNFIDTSKITDMSGLFEVNGEGYNDLSRFDGDISKWNTSNVKNMGSMFHGSQFQGDISKWDVSKVENMAYMFSSTIEGDSMFSGDLSKWDVSNVRNMSGMFYGSNFKGDISNWDVSNVEDMSDMFSGSKVTSDLSKWDVSNVKDMSGMFRRSKYSGHEPAWYRK